MLIAVTTIGSGKGLIEMGNSQILPEVPHQTPLMLQRYSLHGQIRIFPEFLEHSDKVIEWISSSFKDSSTVQMHHMGTLEFERLCIELDSP